MRGTRSILIVGLSIFCFFVLQPVHAQSLTQSKADRDGMVGEKGTAVHVPPSSQRKSLEQALFKSNVVTDTLRNFTLSNTLFRYPAGDPGDGVEGWVHGTNSFEDAGKGTRLSLPAGVETAMLEEVLVTFVHKSDQLIGGSYAIGVYDVASNGGPGNLIGAQLFDYDDIDADEDLGTPAFPTLHIFDSPIPVPSQFFVTVEFGPYDASQYDFIAIASTDFLGRRVAEDYELLSSGNWVNMSDSWFTCRR